MGQWGHRMESYNGRWLPLLRRLVVINRHPGEVTPHAKTDSITDFYSLLVWYFSVVFLFSFKFYQEVLRRWSGWGDHSASPLELFTTNVNVASTRHVLESWTRLIFYSYLLWKLMLRFQTLWCLSHRCYSILSGANIPLDYKRHCEKKGSCWTSSNQTHLHYESVESLTSVL